MKRFKDTEMGREGIGSPYKLLPASFTTGNCFVTGATPGNTRGSEMRISGKSVSFPSILIAKCPSLNAVTGIENVDVSDVANTLNVINK